MADNKFKNLSWDDFQKMGNPENVPKETKQNVDKPNVFLAKSSIRIHLEKKGRGGKSVSIIKGIQMTNTMMKDLEKGLKSYCGVGGTQKNGEILLQGDHRDKIIKYLISKGANDIKKSGA